MEQSPSWEATSHSGFITEFTRARQWSIS